VPFPEELVRKSSINPEANQETGGLRLSQSVLDIGKINSTNWKGSITLHDDGRKTFLYMSFRTRGPKCNRARSIGCSNR
jgi:hypothetical protein